MLDVYPPLANGHPALPYKHPPMADRNFHETNNHLMPTGRTQETNKTQQTNIKTQQTNIKLSK